MHMAMERKGLGSHFLTSTLKLSGDLQFHLISTSWWNASAPDYLITHVVWIYTVENLPFQSSWKSFKLSLLLVMSTRSCGVEVTALEWITNGLLTRITNTNKGHTCIWIIFHMEKKKTTKWIILVLCASEINIFYSCGLSIKSPCLSYRCEQYRTPGREGPTAQCLLASQLRGARCRLPLSEGSRAGLHEELQHAKPHAALCYLKSQSATGSQCQLQRYVHRAAHTQRPGTVCSALQRTWGFYL